MLARVRSAAVLGIDAYLVDVETDIANGLPTFATVGLPQGAVKEGRERVYAALANTGYTFPLKRITVNLAPADIRKDGSAFDLPIAVGILAATEQISSERLGRVAVLGELGLEGAIRPVRGALPVALAARTAGLEALLVPRGDPPGAGGGSGGRGAGGGKPGRAAGFRGGRAAGRRVARGAAAVPRAASHDLGRGADRRRLLPAAGRSEPGARRRAVPGRATRVPQERARSAAPAHGGRRGDDRPRRHEPHLSGALHARCGDESVPLRVLRRSPAQLCLRAAGGGALPRTRLGTAARPHRHPSRGACREVPRACGPGGRRVQ